MENYERVFIASSKIFSGFKVPINITLVDNLEDIIRIFVDNLREILIKYNFENLLVELKKNKFHIHNVTLEDILTSSINDTFYVCDHN